MRQVNLFDCQFDYDPDVPVRLPRVAFVGKQLGAQETAIKLLELPAGEALWRDPSEV